MRMVGNLALAHINTKRVESFFKMIKIVAFIAPAVYIQEKTKHLD